MTSIEQARELDRLLTAVRDAALLEKAEHDEYRALSAKYKQMSECMGEMNARMNQLTYRTQSVTELCEAQRKLADFLIKETT